MNPASAFSSIRHWLNVGLGFLYPEVCQICGEERATVKEGFVGPTCWERVQFIQPPFCDRCGLTFEGDITTAFECANCKEMDLSFHSARSAVELNEFTKDVLHRYKYQRQLWFEPFLADLLVRQAGPVLARDGCQLIVPLPLHTTKRRERGFNQAERLAKCLSRAAKIPMNATLLKRVKPTQTQTFLNRSARAANVRGAFSMRTGVRLRGEKVVLVDDVFTTGATTSACAKVLLAAGAGDVLVWTVARGILK